jgi:hypothetical protein
MLIGYGFSAQRIGRVERAAWVKKAKNKGSSGFGQFAGAPVQFSAKNIRKARRI